MSARRAPLRALVIALAVLLLSCAAGGLAVRQGALTPPELRLELGAVRVTGVVTLQPDCLRLITLGCGYITDETSTRFYSLWLQVQREPGSWEQPRIYRLFRVAIRR